MQKTAKGKKARKVAPDAWRKAMRGTETMICPGCGRSVKIQKSTVELSIAEGRWFDCRECGTTLRPLQG